jgi:hypothetical protein
LCSGLCARVEIELISMEDQGVAQVPNSFAQHSDGVARRVTFTPAGEEQERHAAQVVT